VCSQPSLMVSAVASGRFQLHFMMVSPRRTSSSGSHSMNWYIVGTPKNTEMRSRSIRSATPAGSKLGTTTCVIASAAATE
jgi:hypothetical protein